MNNDRLWSTRGWRKQNFHTVPAAANLSSQSIMISPDLPDSGIDFLWLAGCLALARKTDVYTGASEWRHDDS